MAPCDAEYACARCRAPFANHYALDERDLCGLCRGGETGFDVVYAYGSFEAPLRELIHLFKYGGVAALKRPLGRLARLAVPRERRFDLVVPTPLDWRRRWRRGYNQSALLAEELARPMGLSPAAVLRRLRATLPQAGLSRSARRANVAGAFAVKKPDLVRGRRVLLVDDVMTTGATVRACAQALKRAGAASVSVAVVARAGRGGAAPLDEVRRERHNSKGLDFSRSLQDAQPGSTA